MKSDCYALFDLAQWKNGLAFKKIDFSSDGEPVIKIAELKNGITGQTQFTEGDYGDEVHLTKGDMLFSWSGNPETSIDVFWYNLPDGWLNQHIFKVIPKPFVDRNFLYYLLKSLKATFTAIASNKQTTGLGHITLKDLKKLNIALPSEKEQKIIGRYLYTIDQKISVNQAINDNLQQHLNLLFFQIFTNIIPDIALGEVVETTSGGTPSRKHKEYYENGSICWIKSKELLGSYIHDTEEHINDLALSKSSTKMLPEHSVLIAMYGATVGAYGIISKQMTCNQAICALLSNENYPYTYLFQIAHEQQQNLINMAVGSAQQNISQALVKQLYIHSDIDAIKKFHKLAQPLHQQIQCLERENKTLSEVRDTLLPKLMSGELDVSELDI